MQNINSTAGLKNAIQLLEVERAEKRLLLKEQFYHTYESFKPVNLLKGTLYDMATSPNLIENIISTGLGMATGYVTKKIVVLRSDNTIRKLIGSILQLSVTNMVAQHPEAIKSIGQFIFQHVFRKKDKNSKNSDSQ